MDCRSSETDPFAKAVTIHVPVIHVDLYIYRVNMNERNMLAS